MLKELAKKYPRRYSAAVAVLCFGIAIWDYQHTLERARVERPEYLSSGTFVVMIMTAVGLLLVANVISPDWVKMNFEGMRTRKKTKRDWMLLALFLIPAFAVMLSLEYQLRQLGYQ